MRFITNNYEKKPIYIFLHIPKTGGASLNQNLMRKLSKKEIGGDVNEISSLSPKQKQTKKYIHGHGLYYGIHKFFPDREPRYIVFLRDPAKRRVSQYNHDIHRMKSRYKPSFQKWYESQISDEMCFLLSKKFKGIPGRKVSTKLDPFLNAMKIANSGFRKILGFKVLKFFLSLKRRKEEEFENGMKLLDRSWFVGVTQNLDEDIPKILKALGLDPHWERYRTAKSKGSKISDSKIEVIKEFELDEETRKKIYQDNKLELQLYEHAIKLNKEKTINV